jgi:hypothetical protein
MRLNEHAVDLFEVHDAGLVADSFNQTTDTQIAGATQQAFARADDECQCFGREGVVAQACTIQLIQDEPFDGFGGQAAEQRRAGDAGADFLVDGQGQGLQQGRLTSENALKTCLLSMSSGKPGTSRAKREDDLI